MKVFQRRFPVFCLLALALAFAAGAVTAGAVTPGPVSTGMVAAGVPDLPSFSGLAESAGKSVVNISIEKTESVGGFLGPFGGGDEFQDFFGRFFGDSIPREYKRQGLGTGFVIDKDGHIVTNSHVVEKADLITVRTSDGKKYEAKVIGRDSKTDIALIKIEGASDLPVLPLGDSDALKVGEWVVAIGNPFGLDHTVTAGIVSAKGRAIGAGPYDDFIQTDASINPGNSGGPLLDLDGRAVGINTAMVAHGQGIGFAIPINLVKRIVADLKKSGEVTRGWLGIAVQELSEDVAAYYGVPEKKGILVGSVVEGDPAHKAGLVAGDVITAYNNKPLAEPRDLSRLVAETPVGQKATLSVWRNGRLEKIQVEVARMEEDEAKTAEKPGPRSESKVGLDESMGWSLSDITPQVAKRYELTETSGVVVMAVRRGGRAEKAGLKPGDIIKEINRVPVKDAASARKAASGVKKGETLSLLVNRDGALDVIKVPTE
ncbi:MAG: DegQ family serine endoprotease [Deltaproteobacteria bacterium]|nr:DegQ family serine endoprotease [Deltaproteobacteria bacterium]